MARTRGRLPRLCGKIADARSVSGERLEGQIRRGGGAQARLDEIRTATCLSDVGAARDTITEYHEVRRCRAAAVQSKDIVIRIRRLAGAGVWIARVLHPI